MKLFEKFVWWKWLLIAIVTVPILVIIWGPFWILKVAILRIAEFAAVIESGISNVLGPPCHKLLDLAKR